MRKREYRNPGKFNWRCLFGHLWSEWSRPIVRTRISGGLLGDDYVWTQRKCQRCGAQHGEESF